MNVLEDIICIQCNQKLINDSIQFCRKQFLSSQINEYSETRSVQINEVNIAKNSKTSGNSILDKFIKETQLNSKYCDDFIEWIPRSNLENIKFLTNGGNSNIYYGTWNLLNMSLASMASNQLSSKVALKAINNDSDNIILNELKIHHKCRNPRVIPFYGITKAPGGNEYAMVIRHAEHGDLRNYIRRFFPILTWTNRVKILIELSKALNSIHQMNLLHKDFHCKNILIDEGNRIFISDFGLCQPIDSEIVSNRIQGVLPYIAPEVLRCKPYTKQSEVYSLSMIMWELTSGKPPFSNKCHDVSLAFEVLDELKPLRPEIVKGTPEFYANIMERCWSSDPLKRPDASLLPKLFEDMLCKVADDNIASSKVTCYSSLSKSNFVNNNSVNTGYDTRALDLGLNMAPTKEENTVMINHNNSVDIELSPQTNSVTSSNESIIQSEYKTKAYEYTLEGQYTEFLKYEIKANHLIITILLFDTKYHNFKLLVYTVVSANCKSETEGIYEVARQTTDNIQHTADTVSSTLVNLKSKTTPETTKKIVENQNPDGSIKLDKTVSDQINISSDNIQSSIQTYGVSDKLKSVPKNVWETALSLRYLTITSQSQDQHKEQSEKAKNVKKGKEDAVSTIKKSTTTEKATEIVSSQKEDGSLELPDTVSKALDVESNESLVSSIKTYFIGKGTKAPENKKVIDTAITLSFLRNTSSTDSSPELKEKVAKAEKYLKTELGSEEKIKELLEKTDTVVVDHAAKKVIKEKAEQTIVQEIQKTVTEEEITKVIEIQNKEGSYEKISDQITEKLGEITTENISSSVRITDERVKKFDTKVWNTFITIAYCNKVLGKQQSKVKPQNEQALAWLHTQIKDEKLIKEVLESCEKIVVEKASNKKKESSWPSLSTSLTGWGSSWGKYITDTAKYTTDTVQHTADTVSSTLFNLKSTTTPETTKKIVENQKPDGSIKLDKTVSDQINISSDNIQSSIQTYGVSDKLKSVPKNVWETALSLRYLTITSQSQDQHKEQSDKAKKYLIEELKDEKLELKDEKLVEEILTTSEKIIVDQSVKKGKEDAVSTIKSSTTTEKAKEIVSSQKEDGSLELPDTVSKALDVESNESLVSSIKTYFIGKGTKAPENKKVIDTAITLSFLRNTSSTDSSPELKEKVAKAEKYLKTELGSEEKIKELLEKTDTVVVDHAAKKVIKEKADQSVVQEIQETVTVEEITKVIEIQNKEGSYEKIPDKVTEKLGEITTENISSSVRITDERVKKFDTKVWNTFITIAYCNKVLGKHKSKWTDQNEKARAWLHEQIKDEKLEKEILESCEKIVVEKVSNKKKESSPWFNLLPTWGSSDTTKQTTIKKIESIPVAPTTSTTKSPEKPKESVVSKLAEKFSGTPSTGSPSTASPATHHPKTDTRVVQKDQPKKDQPTPAKPETESKTKLGLFFDNISTSVVKLSKDIEDAITWGEKDDDDHDHDKVDALDTVKTSSATKEVIQYVVSKQNDDGSIEAGETVCKQLDAPSKETIVTTVQQYITNEKLKNAKPIWITTAVNIAYLKNLADQHEGEWKEKYEIAHQYLTKEIGNPKEVDELIDASSKYVVKQSTQKVIKDKKKAAVLAIRSSTPKETINDAISSQKNDGSFEISKTITKELNDTSPADLVKKAQSYVKSDKIKPKNSDSIFKTALMLGYLRTATTDTDNSSSAVSEKYKKAREYLSTQIGDKHLEEDIIKASSKVVIDKSSEKVAEASKKEALKEIQITPEITKTIVSTQKTDGSFEVSKEITDKLNSTSPESLVTSVITYTKNDKLKNVKPSVWQTVISMQYLKNTASQHENDWKDKYNKAEEYVRSQLGDDNL
ncbi:hypothetical protein RhiirA4_456465, partial [Rhizophagus irregularis]